jgi:hypothetical protein
MGTGYNTEVLYKGARYHVQTEDKGIPKAEIVSHIYQGGAILCTKRTSYADIVNDATQMALIQEMTSKQHKDILRTIQQGGLESLKSQIEKEKAQQPDPHVVAKEPLRGPGVRAVPAPPVNESQSKPALTPSYGSEAPKTAAPTPPARLPQTRTIDSATAKSEALPEAKKQESLALDVLTPTEFYAGQKIGLRVLARKDESRSPVADAKVVVKILGMSFRPILFSGKTDREGTFFIALTLPAFTVGQATLEITASADGYGSTDLKFVIQGKQ